MYKLFDFQKEAVTNCNDFFHNSELSGALAVMPTASGKSVVIAEITKNLDNVLVLVPSSELLLQNEIAMINSGVIPCVYSASVSRAEVGKIMLATIGSIQNLGKDIKKAGIKNVICDEAHFKLNFEKGGMFYNFLKDLKPKKILGLTATPFLNTTYSGRPMTRMMHRIKGCPFKEIIHITQFNEVIKSGRWQKLTYIQHPVDMSSLENGSSVEYTEESIQMFLKVNGVNNRVCLLLKELQNEKTLTFTDSLETAQKIKDWYNSKGFKGRCDIVSGDMPKKERKSVVEAFKDVNSDLHHVINYGTLTTGFDFPQLKYVIGARPTNSLNLFIQICGRGGRVHPDKTFSIHHDLVGNVSRFGEVESFNFDRIKDWRMFSGDVCLTDIPQPCLMKVTKSFLRRPPKLKKSEPVLLWFGKYEGKDVRFVPSFYKKFLLKEFEIKNERDKKLYDAMMISEENEFIKISVK